MANHNVPGMPTRNLMERLFCKLEAFGTLARKGRLFVLSTSLKEDIFIQMCQTPQD